MKKLAGLALLSGALYAMSKNKEITIKRNPVTKREQRLHELVMLAGEGWSMTEVARYLDVSDAKVWQLAREFNIKFSGHKTRSKSVVNEKLIKELFDAGLSQFKIARELKISPSTVTKALKRMGLTRR